MHKILVPLGISEKIEGLLNYAIHLSKIFKSIIYLIDAHPTSSNLTSINNVKSRFADKSKQKIKSMVDNLNSNVSNINIMKSQGDFIDSTKKLNKSIGVDLVITVPLSNEINDEMFLGPVARSLIKRTNIPVLAAPYQKQFIPNHKVQVDAIRETNKRNTHYHLTDQQAAELRKDTRILAVIVGEKTSS